MKKFELKNLDETQLKLRLDDLKKDLMKVNTQISTGTSIENPGRVIQLKRNVARILTYLKAMEDKNKKYE
ncbi:50S ribosomal protein L29 [archaeon]|nr:50S ribosomal protein L29 [archaeon]